MAQRSAAPQHNHKPNEMDFSEAVSIARLRVMITRSEARKARRDFADAIQRLESSAVDAKPQGRGFGASQR